MLTYSVTRLRDYNDSELAAQLNRYVSVGYTVVSVQELDKPRARPDTGTFRIVLSEEI